LNIFNKSERSFRFEGKEVKPGNNEVSDELGDKLMKMYPVEIIPFSLSGVGVKEKVASLEDQIKTLKEDLRVMTNDRDGLKKRVDELNALLVAEKVETKVEEAPAETEAEAEAEAENIQETEEAPEKKKKGKK